MNKIQIKKILFIFLIIIFLPFAAYTLINQEFGWFIGGALIVYVIIQLSNKFLVEKK